MSEARIGRNGLIGDRTHMVVDANGNFLSGRKHPNMSLIRTSLGTRGLELSAPYMGQIGVDTDPDTKREITTFVHGNPVPSITQNPDADEWMSDFLGNEARIVALDPQNHRQLSEKRWQPHTTNRTGFSDGGQILVASQSSLDALNTHLGEDNEVSMDRFRPNLVFSGLPAWDEDTWRTIANEDNISLDLVWACSRCVMTENDPYKGVRDDPRVLKALREVGRKGVDAFGFGDKGVFFGVNASVPNSSVGRVLSASDSFEVLERGESNIVTK